MFVIIPPLPPHKLGAHLSRVIMYEKCEEFISEFMPLHNHSSLNSVSFAIMKALLPSLVPDDIRGVRFVCSTSSEGPMRDHTEMSPSFIVRLKSPELAKLVFNARRSYNNNYFSTKDIDCSTLSSEQCTASARHTSGHTTPTTTK